MTRANDLRTYQVIVDDVYAASIIHSDNSNYYIYTGVAPSYKKIRADYIKAHRFNTNEYGELQFIIDSPDKTVVMYARGTWYSVKECSTQGIVKEGIQTDDIEDV